MNTHGIADFSYELQAVCADQLPACILSQTGLAVPVPPGLVLPAFSTEGYVRETDTLVYVEQEAHTVTFTGADGTFWLALATDTWTAYAQWTTEAGTHYRWRPSATQPADVAGLLTFASVTIAGGAVTAVSPLPTVTRAAAGRALLGLGTMATQNATAVAISGGTATLASATVAGDTYTGRLGVNVAPASDSRAFIQHAKSGHGLKIQPNDADTGGGTEVLFLNYAAGVVGYIGTNATTTTYATSSDVRLKHAVATLTDALTRVRALRPVAFRWNQDDSRGVGFLAHELQQTIPEAVTGEPDAVDDDGSIRPQGVDHSKLVPWLTASVQELAAQVQALTARIVTLEQALGA